MRYWWIAFLLVACSPASENRYTATQAAKVRPRMAAKTRSRILHSKPLVIIDPGHGDHDRGARHNKMEEKTLALTTSHLIKDKLNSMGYRVMLTRTNDKFVPLEERAQIANDAQASIFVSVHYNSARTKDASGIEIFYYHKSDKSRLNHSKKLAHSVIKRMVTKTGARDRGIKGGNFCVIRETKMPAILVEGGFMTHPKEARQLKSSNYLEKVAQGIAEGIDSYFLQSKY